MRHRIFSPTATVASVALLAATIFAHPVGAAPTQPPASVVTAAVTPPSGPLTLSQCVRFALEKSPATRAAQAALRAARQGTAIAKSSFYPSVGFKAGFSRWQRRIFLPSEIEKIPGFTPVVGPYDDWTASLGASYTLFDGGDRKARLGAAEAGEAGIKAHHEATQQDVTLGVEQAFYGLLAARENLNVAVESLARSEDHVKLAKDRKDVGAVPLADVLRAQVDAANARLALVQAQALVRTARAHLATVMGLPSETVIEIAPGKATIRAPATSEVSAALDQAASRRPDVEQARQKVAAARLEVGVARSAFLPRVDAAAAYGREDTRFFPRDNTWQVGVDLSFPIFTGFSRVHQLERARAELAQAEAMRDRLTLAVREQGWDAFSNVREAYEAVRTTQALVASAEESHRYARERYKVGAGTITDLLDSETALARAEASRVNAEWEYHSAQAKLQWTLGEILPTASSSAARPRRSGGR